MSEQNCGTCRWWVQRGKEEITELTEGECHRYPPNVPCVNRVNDLGIAIPETALGSILMTYPITYAPEWCGEYSYMPRGRRGL